MEKQGSEATASMRAQLFSVTEDGKSLGSQRAFHYEREGVTKDSFESAQPEGMLFYPANLNEIPTPKASHTDEARAHNRVHSPCCAPSEVF